MIGLLTVKHWFVGDVLALEVVLGDHLIDFILCFFGELILPYFKLNDSGVLQKSCLQCVSVTLLNLIT